MPGFRCPAPAGRPLHSMRLCSAAHRAAPPAPPRPPLPCLYPLPLAPASAPAPAPRRPQGELARTQQELASRGQLVQSLQLELASAAQSVQQLRAEVGQLTSQVGGRKKCREGGARSEERNEMCMGAAFFFSGEPSLD